MTTTVSRRSGATPLPRRWIAVLATVLGLAAIIAGQLGPNRYRIEGDLAKRADAALSAAGQPRATVSFAGQDALVVATSEADAESARSVLAAVPGVRNVSIRVVMPAENTEGTPGTPDTPDTPGTPERSGNPIGTGIPGTAEGSGIPTGTGSPEGTDRSGGTGDPRVTENAGTPDDAGDTAAEATRRRLIESAERARAVLAEREREMAVQKQLDDLAALTFDSGGSRLTAESRNVLKEVAVLLEADPKLGLRVGGHTDSRGSTAANLALSRDRAAAVKSALVEYGVPADRLTAKGYGESRPAVPNDTAGHRAENRRVELVIHS
ncbi:MAG TPA: OmpA family protein [Actinoplanes sp.]|nr:OmpA family protein [Actinoplanes sp.]